MQRPFLKMNGLGNDFIIVDARRQAFAPAPDEIRRLASRSEGIGCDQFVLVAPSAEADATVRFWNPDGGEAGACGNASRWALFFWSFYWSFRCIYKYNLILHITF